MNLKSRIGVQWFVTLVGLALFAFNWSPARADINDGLVGYWSFDEGGGSIAYDQSGQGHDGTIYGATWVSGVSGMALDFDGVNDYVDVGQYTMFGGTQPFSICAWQKKTVLQPGEAMICGNKNSSAGGVELVVTINVACTGVGGIDGLPGGNRVSGTSPMNDGVWHFLVGVYDGQAQLIYVDCAREGIESDLFDTYTSSNEHMNIGRQAQGSRFYFNGVIDEVRIYDRALSPEEITELAIGNITGDLNCDGQVNSFDIDPFVLALTSPSQYPAAYPDCDWMLADINEDGFVDNSDIDPFVDLVTGE